MATASRALTRAIKIPHERARFQVLGESSLYSSSDSDSDGRTADDEYEYDDEHDPPRRTTRSRD